MHEPTKHKLPSSSTGITVLSNPRACRYSRVPSTPLTFSFGHKTTRYLFLFMLSVMSRCPKREHSYLKHFVADFDLRILLLCWILTDVIHVPARTLVIHDTVITIRVSLTLICRFNSPYLLMMSTAALTFSLSLLKV